MLTVCNVFRDDFFHSEALIHIHPLIQFSAFFLCAPPQWTWNITIKIKMCFDCRLSALICTLYSHPHQGNSVRIVTRSVCTLCIVSSPKIIGQTNKIKCENVTSNTWFQTLCSKYNLGRHQALRLFGSWWGSARPWLQLSTLSTSAWGDFPSASEMHARLDSGQVNDWAIEEYSTSLP